MVAAKGVSLTAAGERANTLRLDERTLRALMDKLDAARGASTGRRRRFTRHPYRSARVRLTITHPGGSSSSLTVCARDISAGGVSLLHSNYMHKGSDVVVTLIAADRAEVAIPGKIVRCEQIVGLIHEVGVAFSQRISVREFVEADPLSEFLTLDRVEPAELKGRLLHFDPSEVGRRMVRAMLAGSGLIIEQARTPGEALDICKSALSAVITPWSCEGWCAATILDTVRSRAAATPVIVVRDDDSTATRTAIRAAAPDLCLRKPLSQDVLCRALGEVLLLGKPATPTPDQSTDLMRAFIAQLSDSASALRDGLGTNNSERCLAACRELVGSAPALGFTMIAELAESAERAIIAGGAPAEARPQIEGLAEACARAAA